MISLKLKEPGSKSPAPLGFQWWRGQDLNLRPSGYEPDARPLPWSRPVPFRTSGLGFRTFDVPACPTADQPIPARGVEGSVELPGAEGEPSCNPDLIDEVSTRARVSLRSLWLPAVPTSTQEIAESLASSPVERLPASASTAPHASTRATLARHGETVTDGQRSWSSRQHSDQPCPARVSSRVLK